MFFTDILVLTVYSNFLLAIGIGKKKLYPAICIF